MMNISKSEIFRKKYKNLIEGSERFLNFYSVSFKPLIQDEDSSFKEENSKIILTIQAKLIEIYRDFINFLIDEFNMYGRTDENSFLILSCSAWRETHDAIFNICNSRFKTDNKILDFIIEDGYKTLENFLGDKKADALMNMTFNPNIIEIERYEKAIKVIPEWELPHIYIFANKLSTILRDSDSNPDFNYDSVIVDYIKSKDKIDDILFYYIMGANSSDFRFNLYNENPNEFDSKGRVILGLPFFKFMSKDDEYKKFQNLNSDEGKEEYYEDIKRVLDMKYTGDTYSNIVIDCPNGAGTLMLFLNYYSYRISEMKVAYSSFFDKVKFLNNNSSVNNKSEYDEVAEYAKLIENFVESINIGVDYLPFSFNKSSKFEQLGEGTKRNVIYGETLMNLKHIFHECNDKIIFSLLQSVENEIYTMLMSKFKSFIKNKKICRGCSTDKNIIALETAIKRNQLTFGNLIHILDSNNEIIKSNCISIKLFYEYLEVNKIKEDFIDICKNIKDIKISGFKGVDELRNKIAHTGNVVVTDEALNEIQHSLFDNGKIFDILSDIGRKLKK